MEELVEWLSGEPSCRKAEIRFLGEDAYSGPQSLQPLWEARVWSQRADGSHYKEPGVGTGSTMQWAVFRAMTAYFDGTRLQRPGVGQ